MDDGESDYESDDETESDNDNIMIVQEVLEDIVTPFEHHGCFAHTRHQRWL